MAQVPPPANQNPCLDSIFPPQWKSTGSPDGNKSRSVAVGVSKQFLQFQTLPGRTTTDLCQLPSALLPSSHGGEQRVKPWSRY